MEQGTKSNVGLIVVGVVVAFVVLLIGICGISYVSAYNFGNRTEASIKATYENNRNILAQYTQKVQEAARVPGMMRDDLSKVIRDTMEGRYGADGAKATVLWLKEQGQQLSPALYTKIQQLVEAGRNEFQQNQTRLIDEKRAYEVARGNFWQGLWLGVAGYPKINLDDYKIVTNTYSDKAFEAGKEDGPLKLR